MCAAAGVRSDGVRARGACRQKDPLVKSDRHPLERVGRLTDYSVVPHPARDCDSRDAGASTCVCIKAFPASGVGRGPGRSNTKSRSRSGSDAETPRGAPADVIQSQLFDSMCCDAVLHLTAYSCRWLHCGFTRSLLHCTFCARRSRVACARWVHPLARCFARGASNAKSVVARLRGTP